MYSFLKRKSENLINYAKEVSHIITVIVDATICLWKVC